MCRGVVAQWIDNEEQKTDPSRSGSVFCWMENMVAKKKNLENLA